MKKGMTLVLAMTMAAAALTACGSKSTTTAPAASSNETAAEGETSVESTASFTTVKDGVLMVGSEIGYPPMEYFDEDGATPIGFDMELAQAIADDMGLELEIVDTAWDGIFAGVDTGKYDVIMAAVSYTEDRDANYTLSRTYVANAPVLIVPNESDITGIDDMNGRSVAVQMESTADYLVQRLQADGLGVENKQYEKVINAFDELKAGRVDAVCTDAVVATYYLGDDSDSYKIVWESDEKEPICMCFKKGNVGLKDAMEASLDHLKANGKLGEIATKYFGSDITADLN